MWEGEHWHVDMQTPEWGCEGGPGLIHCWSPSSLWFALIHSWTILQMPFSALGAGMLLEDHIGQNSTCRITFCVFLTTESSLRTEVTGYLPRADTSRTEEPGGLQSMETQRVRTDWVTEQKIHTGRSRPMEGGEIAYCTWLTPNPPSPYSPPSHPFLLICWGVNRSVSMRLSIDALFKAKNMSRIDISAVLLMLQGTLVAGISGSEASNQVQSKSQITSPLQTGGKGGECMEGVGRGVWWMLPALSGFLLWSEQMNSRDTSWFSKSMWSAFNKNIPPHFTKSWTSSLRLSISSLYLVPKCHFRKVKRSIFDP